MVNYYDILEVHQEVSVEEIKRSFRTLIKKYHPDIHSRNKLWAESKTKIIIQAYKTLSDSVTREQYDKQYKHLFQTRKKSSFSKKETTLDSDIQARVLSLPHLLLDELRGCRNNLPRLMSIVK